MYGRKERLYLDMTKINTEKINAMLGFKEINMEIALLTLVGK